jgi:hypothetical protein
MDWVMPFRAGLKALVLEEKNGELRSLPAVFADNRTLVQVTISGKWSARGPSQAS